MIFFWYWPGCSKDPFSAEIGILKAIQDSSFNTSCIQAFYCLKCPECEYNTIDENYFEDHAIENHPLSFVLFNKQFEQKRNFKEEFDVVNVKEENFSYSDEMEDCSNFESSSTDVPGNYPEVLMTEGQGNLLKGIDYKTIRR